MTKFKALIKSKTFWIATIGLIVLALGSFVAFRKTDKQTRPVSQSPIQKNDESPPAAKIVVGNGIFVNNFKIDAQELPGGDEKISDEAGYEIIYFDKFDSFLISILSADFDYQKGLAQEAFLSKLDISEKEACLLNVSITTPVYVNSKLAGQVFRLSFCD